MDEDTKNEPEWLTEIRAELNSAPGYMAGDSGDIDRGAVVKLLRDRDHWKREAQGRERAEGRVMARGHLPPVETRPIRIGLGSIGDEAAEKIRQGLRGAALAGDPEAGS